MKRFVALILALILPVCAFAETIEMSLSVQAKDALFEELVSRNTADLTSADVVSLHRLARMLQVLLNDFSFTVVSQEDAVSVDVNLNGIDLFDMTVYQEGSETQMASSLIPGYVLVEPAEEDETLPAESESMEALSESLEQTVSKWWNGLESTQTSGVFVGDAYSGGTKCTTWSVTDRDIAALFSALLTTEIRELIEGQSEAAEGTESILSALEAANDRVAEESKYAYTVRSVQDAQDKLIGLSITLFEKEVQMATISVGILEESLRIVIGLGLKQQNYWSECILSGKQNDHQKFFTAEFREWTADKSESFAYVCQTDAPAASNLLKCTLSGSDESQKWDGHLYDGLDENEMKEVLHFSGESNTIDHVFESTVKVLDNKETQLTLLMRQKSVDAIVGPDSTLTRCSAVDPAQEALFKEVTEKLIYALTERLLKAIPLDVFMTMNELFE